MAWSVVARIIGYMAPACCLRSQKSNFCHDASVKKLPLSAACQELPFDITKAQPQLFVARDFEHLHEVLHEAKLRWRTRSVALARSRWRELRVSWLRWRSNAGLSRSSSGFQRN